MDFTDTCTEFSCRYELVRGLKDKISHSLGPLIEEEVNDLSLTPHANAAAQETLLRKITEKILDSLE